MEELLLMQFLASVERLVSSAKPSGLKNLVLVNYEALETMDRMADTVRENLRETDSIVGDSEEDNTLG